MFEVWVSFAYVFLGAFWVSLFWCVRAPKDQLPRAVQIISITLFGALVATGVYWDSSFLSILLILALYPGLALVVLANVDELWGLRRKSKKKNKWTRAMDLVLEGLCTVAGLCVFTLGLVFVIAAVDASGYSFSLPIGLIGMLFIGLGGLLFFGSHDGGKK